MIVELGAERPGILAKNMWNERLVLPLKSDTVVNKKIADPVPASYKEVCEWAIVVSKSVVIDHMRPFMVLYKRIADTTSSTIYPVTVCLQGFLGHHDLSLFGSWDGYVFSNVHHYCVQNLSIPGLKLERHRQFND